MDDDSKDLIKTIVDEVARERAIEDAMVFGVGFYMIPNDKSGVRYIPLENVIIDGKIN